MAKATQVSYKGQFLTVTNLDKVLFPESGFTKGQLIQYYAEVGQFMLDHVKQRCITTKRWPNGVTQNAWFQKNCPKPRPDFIDTSDGPSHTKRVEYCLIDSEAGLVWLANLAAIEVHLPMAKCTSVAVPDFAVFDLDPGPGIGLRECCQTAMAIRKLLSGIGLNCFAKTSGKKGLQIYVPLNNAEATHEKASKFVKGVAEVLANQDGSIITVEMAKAKRKGRIFIDWSQNSEHKTTIGVYSVRGTANPQVSTPLLWSEVVDGASQDVEPVFSPDQVLARVKKMGDVFGETLTLSQKLPL